MAIAESKVESFFKAISYGVVFTALFTLFASGSVGPITAIFFSAIIVLSWFLEGSRWQLSERLSIVVIILVIPLFYFDWYFKFSGFNSQDAFTAGSLSRLILLLSSIKLLQRKTDRDWFIIFLIAFFEILLAAGVGISPLFILGLLLYLLLSFISIILFEIKKSSASVTNNTGKTKSIERIGKFETFRVYRIPVTAIFMLVAISMFAVPLFFAFPRVGGANFGGSFAGLSSFTGFSDSVRLGEIGKLQKNNDIVMRVRVENPEDIPINYFSWRGVALDTFDNQRWKKSSVQLGEPIIKNDKDVFMLGNPGDGIGRITQTIYLEPLDTPVLFTLPRPLALQGNFQVVNRDFEGSISSYRMNWSRISYKAISEVSNPIASELRLDTAEYPKSFSRYLQLPENLDQRIAELAKNIVTNANAESSYDKAKAIEEYLQTQYAYTLDLKAGGEQPLADFLFNVREGHCEYFASSLAIMLRTQGIATRVVNGFQQGEYNETAEVYVVRQSDAHSWVEVYFPQKKAWIPFDATPAAGQNSQANAAGFGSKLNSMIEALETYWIQYVVSFDNQEQRSLFRSVRSSLAELQTTLFDWFDQAKQRFLAWWKELRGDSGFAGSMRALVLGVASIAISVFATILAIWCFRMLPSLQILNRLRKMFQRKQETTIIEFYQRLQAILAKRGLSREPHQTPLEFAFASELPQAIAVTVKYNQVRFGEQNLSTEDSFEIENWLSELEESDKQ